jgi:photosystem II stability/assembly factor-like uncharacterized protein
MMIPLGTASLLHGQWKPVTTTGTKASLRGVHNIAGGVIWASGSGGTILRSADNGSVWRQCSTPLGAEGLDFRGIWGFSENRAVVMSSGPGSSSRLYETIDGCHSWHLLFENPDPAGFWDAIAFRRNVGTLLGDPVDGHFVIYRTNDSGRHWIREKSTALAANPKGEGAFAASNSALVVRPDGKKILFGTGGPGGPRIFMSNFKSRAKWTTATLPGMGKGDSAGVFSLAFRDREHGVAVGGDYKNPENRDGTAAFTPDGGVSWRAAAVPPSGYRSSVGWDQHRQAWISVGPNGSDVSTDDGQTWHRLDGASWNALSIPWVVGSNGRIARLGEDASRILQH